MVGGVVVERYKGTPQGGPLSPLLSNIMLDDLDRKLEKRGHKFCRYADDCNIYLRSERAAKRTYNSIVRFIEAKLKLKVNRTKSAVDKADRRKFLGYSYYTPREGTVRLRLGPGVAKRQKDKIRQITKRSRSRSLSTVISEINVAMTGFINYFKLADMKMFLIELEKWIRRKLRVIIWKHWKNCKTRFRKLVGMGLSPKEATVANSRKIYWRVSISPQLSGIMGIAYFRDMGLINLVERYSLVR